jgi:molybdate transport system ATP-binding protein
MISATYSILLNQNQSSVDALLAIEKSSLLNLQNLKGGEFSKKTLIQFLKEESNHGVIDIRSEQNASLSTMSSGQQRKALLMHLLNKNLDYIILDDVLSNLDIQNKIEITQLIFQYVNKINFIQLAYRKDEMIDWIKDKYILKNNELFRIGEKESFSDRHPKFDPKIQNVFSQKKSTLSIEDPLIKFTNVNVSYGEKHVLKNLNLQINQGEFWQIKGPNGSGKSTILSMIYGDNPKAYGQEIYLFGKKKGSGESVWDIKKKIGYLASSTTMLHYRNDTVIHMIIGGLRDTIGLYHQPSLLEINKATDWIHALGIFELKDKPFKTLSSGFQSMVMVARAMIKEPLLLILDEPTVGLDEENATMFVTLVNSIAKSKKTAILYVSHRNEINLNPDFKLELT